MIPIDLNNYKNKNKNLDKLKTIVNQQVNHIQEEGPNPLLRRISKKNNSIKRMNQITIVQIITAVKITKKFSKNIKRKQDKIV